MIQECDIAILGGGITGAGIAREAALRGMSVALFDKDDFGSGTSSKSSKMIHGGLRYLEQGEIGLVFESVSERRVQTRVAPHLVRPLPFLVPVYQDTKPGLELMNLGLWIYDSLAMFRAPKMHRTIRGAKATSALEPSLRTQGLRGVIEYYDCATDDARLVLENVLDARALGATCRNYTEVVAVERDDAGRVCGVRTRDVLTGETQSLRCRMLVIAAGPWTDQVRRSVTGGDRQLLRPTKGVHIVVPHHRLPLRRAITLISPVDGRVMFALPWRERTVIGTTDTDFTGSPDDVIADADDVGYLCRSANGYFPAANLTEEDVLATWAGLRPLIRSEDSDESDVSREHEIYVGDDATVTIAGGKLTTYRRMAIDVVRKAVEWMKESGRLPPGVRDVSGSKERPLPGAEGLPSADLEGVAAIGRELVDQGLDVDSATHLCGVYGSRAREVAMLIAADRSLAERLNPDLPYLWAEVDFAARAELVRTVSDVLGRRVPLLVVGRDQGLDVCDRVAARLAPILRLSPATVEAQTRAYRELVAESRRFRTPTLGQP